jgi:hypothetical protein
MNNLDSGFYSKDQLEGLSRVVFTPLNQPTECGNRPLWQRPQSEAIIDHFSSHAREEERNNKFM